MRSCPAAADFATTTTSVPRDTWSTRTTTNARSTSTSTARGSTNSGIGRGGSVGGARRGGDVPAGLPDPAVKPADDVRPGAALLGDCRGPRNLERLEERHPVSVERHADAVRIEAGRRERAEVRRIRDDGRAHRGGQDPARRRLDPDEGKQWSPAGRTGPTGTRRRAETPSRSAPPRRRSSAPPAAGGRAAARHEARAPRSVPRDRSPPTEGHCRGASEQRPCS